MHPLTDHLYQKRLLYNAYDSAGPAISGVNSHDIAIASLIKTYETTYLTAAEKEQWALFKENLENYSTQSGTQIRNEKVTNTAFDKLLQSLNALSSIQANEGSKIFKISSVNINGTIIMSQLEIALLLILGIFALVLISLGDNKLLQIQNQRLN